MSALLTENLTLLASAPNGIRRLRELILELAVRGKLLPQDPSDEPANELLKRIAEEKARLVAEGKIKKDKAVDDAIAEISYPIPSTWAVASLGQVVEIVRGITFPASEKSKEPEPGRVACLRTATCRTKLNGMICYTSVTVLSLGLISTSSRMTLLCPWQTAGASRQSCTDWVST
jgi:type I restriction enzyme, S subunit